MSWSSLSFTTQTSLGYHCIEIILSRTSERNGDAAGSRCWRTLCAGRLPTSKGPTRNGRLLPAHQSQHHHVFSPGVVDQVYLVVGAAHGGDSVNEELMKMFWSETVMIIGRWSTTAILVTLFQEARASQLRCWKYHPIIGLKSNPQSSVDTFTQREDIENNFVGSVVSEGGGRLWKKCPKKCRKNREWEHCWIICSEIKDLCQKLTCQFFRWSSPRSEADSGVSQQIDLHSNSLVTAHNIQHKLTFTF